MWLNYSCLMTQVLNFIPNPSARAAMDLVLSGCGPLAMGDSMETPVQQMAMWAASIPLLWDQLTRMENKHSMMKAVVERWLSPTPITPRLTDPAHTYSW